MEEWRKVLDGVAGYRTLSPVGPEEASHQSLT